MAGDGSAKLGDLTVDWLTKFLRQQQQLYPTRSVDTLSAEQLEVVKTLLVKDQVIFSAYGAQRFIGSQGQPTALNSWVPFGPPYQTPWFTKGPDLIVRLGGVIKSGTLGSPAFQLPPGFRPDSLLSLPTMSNGVFGRIDIDITGNVTPQSPSSNASVVLDNLTFPAS